jgi:hypothetical protein
MFYNFDFQRQSSASVTPYTSVNVLPLALLEQQLTVGMGEI